MKSNLSLIAGEKYRKLENNPIAFFCMEYALDDRTEMYAGGLGVLAGDFLYESGDQGLPLIAFGLKYKSNKPIETKDDFEVLKIDGKVILLDIPVDNSFVKVMVWTKRFKESTVLVLFDSDIEENNEYDRKITSHLYDTDFYLKIKQELVLGIGGVKLLNILNISPKIYHLNEGNGALASLGLLAEESKKNPGKNITEIFREIREKVVATKHTIFPAAGPFIQKKDFFTIFKKLFEDTNIDINDIYNMGKLKEDCELFSSTKFLIEIAVRENGVSAIHTRVEKKLHPKSELITITNGVYKKRWQSISLQENLEKISDEDLWSLKNKNRLELIDFVRNKTNISLSPDACTIVWARRFAKYKRPYLLFSDLEKLKKIIENINTPVQFIIAGKSHENDLEGQKLIKDIISYTEDPSFFKKIVYLKDYSLPITHKLVNGADIWLNTPEKGKEACGTSGMKAGLNGAIQVSVSDGWIDEVNLSKKGWILSERNTAKSLYKILSKKAIPLFYKRDKKGIPVKWLKMMRASIELTEKNFTSKRMIEDYLEKLYKV